MEERRETVGLTLVEQKSKQNMGTYLTLRPCHVGHETAGLSCHTKLQDVGGYSHPERSHLAIRP